MAKNVTWTVQQTLATAIASLFMYLQLSCMKYFLLILQHFLYVIIVHFWLNQHQKGAKVASLCCAQHQTGTIHCSIVYCNQIFIHQVVMGRRQRREEEEEMRRGNDCNKGYCFSFRVELPAPVYHTRSSDKWGGYGYFPIFVTLVWLDRESNPNLPLQ